MFLTLEINQIFYSDNQISYENCYSDIKPLFDRWFKLLDKTGKVDKDRGEVLVDIQFMRNNMTASMFDLSAAGKSRSRLGKFKDKVRGKKKESDTMSTIVPSFTQVLTDSEEEGNGDAEAAAGKDEKKKKHKMKSLFSPKSNLQKNMSQSMSVLPGKNSPLSGSQSSGLNVDPSEGQEHFHSLSLVVCVYHMHVNFLISFQVKRSSNSRFTNDQAAQTTKIPPPVSKNMVLPNRVTCASMAVIYTVKSRRPGPLASARTSVWPAQDTDPWKTSPTALLHLLIRSEE